MLQIAMAPAAVAAAQVDDLAPTVSRVYPGSDGKLVYVADEQGNTISDPADKVDRAGLEPVKYAGHSLRAGRATSAAIAGASERSIMNQTGHRSVQMVRRYIRDGNLFKGE
jgi:integrase